MSAVPEAPTADEIEAAAVALHGATTLGGVLWGSEPEEMRDAYRREATRALAAAYPLLVARITNQAKAEALREAASRYDAVHPLEGKPVADWLRERARRVTAGEYVPLGPAGRIGAGG